MQGSALAHGQVMAATHPSLRGADVGQGIDAWVLVLHRVIEDEREDDDELAQTLLLVPVSTKKPVAGAAAAVALADKQARDKWEKIAVALEQSA